MKIRHHFIYKKAFSYSRFCKRNFFLTHGFQIMNFFSFPYFTTYRRFLQKNQSQQQNFAKLNLPSVSIGVQEFFQYFEIFSISPHLILSNPHFPDKIAIFGQIGGMGHFPHSILVKDFNFSFKIEKKSKTWKFSEFCGI